MDAAYSLRPEEQRQAAKAGGKQRSARRGRMTTQEKLDRAERVEIVLPEGFAIEDCRLLYRRPVWRIEQGRAVLVAYEFYRGPQGERGTAAGLLPRCEFGLEILITLAHRPSASRSIKRWSNCGSSGGCSSRSLKRTPCSAGCRASGTSSSTDSVSSSRCRRWCIRTRPRGASVRPGRFCPSSGGC